MGVGGGFWDELRVVVKNKPLDWLHGKRLAIDLSYWIVQQQSAVSGAPVRKPHLRILFFRVVNLISRAGALPVFVIDGDPPPEKLAVRMERFSRRMCASSDTPPPQPQDQVLTRDSHAARNSVFQQNIEECVELLDLLGMPVLQAAWEAEGLCAELDREGWVDACVTADSDALLHGAKCIIKALQVDSKVPLVETYAAEDIKTMLGLDREHMIALALLVGCDYDKKGVAGIGCSHAMRLVQSVSSDKIFDRLKEWGKGEHTPGCPMDLKDGISGAEDKQDEENSEACGEALNTKRSSLHCSNCGHPGTKREHTTSGCAFCKSVEVVVEATDLGCVQKGKGFQCPCRACVKKGKIKKRIKQRDWWVKYCNKMATTDGFPNEDIINIFLRPGSSNFAGGGSPTPLIKWGIPKMELLEEFLHTNLHWDAQTVRQRTLPLLSTICLEGMAARNQRQPKIWNEYPFENSILGRFTPHSIKRIKVAKSRELYMLQWMGLVGFPGNPTKGNWLGTPKKSSAKQHSEDQETGVEDGDTIVTESEQENNELGFTTVEDMKLVGAACPSLVEAFEQEQAVKEMAKASRKGTKRKASEQQSDYPSQQSIKAFFKVRKGASINSPGSKLYPDGSSSPEILSSCPPPARITDAPVDRLRKKLFP